MKTNILRHKIGESSLKVFLKSTKTRQQPTVDSKLTIHTTYFSSKEQKKYKT